MNPRTFVTRVRLIAALLAASLAMSGASEAWGIPKTWVGSSGGGDGVSWSDGNNWSPSGAPGATDDAVLDNSTVAGSYTVTLPGGVVTTTINRLTIGPTAGTITLVLPTANTAVPGFRVGDAVAATEDIILNSGAALRNQSGAATGNGIEANSTTNGLVRINNGARYVHNTLRSTAGIVPLLSTVAGSENGIFEYDSPGIGTQAISASGRNYGSLVLTRSAGAATYTSSGASALTIRGHFIINIGVTYNSSMSGAMNLARSLFNAGAALSLPVSPATQTVNFNGSGAQAVVGPVTLTAASSVGAASVLSVGTAFSSNGAMTVNGTVEVDGAGLPGGSGTYAYTAGSGSLGISTPSPVAISGQAFWPAASAPHNVTVTGAGSLAMSVARTVNGTFQTELPVTGGDQLTLNGTCRINDGGSVTGSPTYGSAATLAYDLSSGTVAVGDEWGSGSAPGVGVPKHVSLSGSTTLDLPSSDRTVPGNLDISGATLRGNTTSGDLAVGGNWTNTGTYVPSGRTVRFNGVGAQSISNAAGESFDNLFVNKASGGLSLANGVTVAQTLTLSSGVVATGSNVLAVAPGGTATGASAISYVNGNLKKRCTISSGSGSQMWEIGGASNYAPVMFSTTTGATQLDITASTIDGDHPSLGTSTLNSAKSVNRWWTMALDPGQSFGSADVTFQFDPADVDGGANTAAFVVQKYDAPTWSSTGTGTRTAISTQATGITGFSDFAIGEASAHNIVASAGTGGTIDPSGTVSVVEGDDQGFTITASTCYHIADVLVDDISVGPVASYTFTNVQASHTIDASFALNIQTLTVTTTGSGTVDKLPNQTSFDCGSPVTLTPMPGSGFHFDSWSGDATGSANPLIVTMDADKTIVANFVANPTVVISQVYGGGGNVGATLKNDFIELFNRGGSAADLTGWTVQYAAAAGTTWQMTSLSGSIAAGGYYLVQEAQGAGGTVDLPTPDATGTIAMSASAAKVALKNNATALSGTCPSDPAILDLVGYGTTASCSEGSPVTGLGNTAAGLRKVGGCEDTNNNAADFAAGSPTPRNSASPTHTCVITLDVSVDPPGSGTVSRSPDLPSYPLGALVELTATLVSGYHFTHWSGDASGIANPLTIVMTGPKSIVAHFALNSLSGIVVISQVYGGGGNIGATYKNDFIELFNRGNDVANVTGWSVQYASSDGIIWDTTNLIGTIQPGGYFLVQQAAGIGGTLDLPTPDAFGTIEISAVRGKVALVNNQTPLTGSCPGGTGIVDQVGYGLATCSETPPTSTLDNTHAGLRKSGGCEDTDNNLADFGVGAPTPRNTSSPINFCPTWTGVKDEADLGFALGPIVPNPVRGSFGARFVLPYATQVRLRMVDVQGRIITTLADGTFPAGEHRVTWNGATATGTVRSGLYFIRMEAAGRNFIQRVAITN